MTAGGVWVLVGLAAIALASPWAAVAVALLLAVIWLPQGAESPSNQSHEASGNTGPETAGALEENEPKLLSRITSRPL